MKTSDNIDKIAPALVEIQDSMVAVKDADNPFFKSKYAPLDEILKSIRPTLKDNGITILQSIDAVDRKITCITRIMHSSGQWIDSTMALDADKSTPQGFGSAATYARRYGICAALSISTPNEDDDGNKAELELEKVNKKNEIEKTLRKLQAASLPKFLKYDAEAIQTAFEESGYVSELEDKEAMTAELIKQTNSKEKLKTIGLRTKVLQEEIDASLTK